ncbi:hypothetical protein BJ742DRAFT_842457 [Cladochytrium replicatum]|nr:hypothetical protein BJ742DRAFT_842457 [Cladochytrium replicatum]
MHLEDKQLPHHPFPQKDGHNLNDPAFKPKSNRLQDILHIDQPKVLRPRQLKDNVNYMKELEGVEQSQKKWTQVNGDQHLVSYIGSGYTSMKSATTKASGLDRFEGDATDLESLKHIGTLAKENSYNLAINPSNPGEYDFKMPRSWKSAKIANQNILDMEHPTIPITTYLTLPAIQITTRKEHRSGDPIDVHLDEPCHFVDHALQIAHA